MSDISEHRPLNDQAMLDSLFDGSEVAIPDLSGQAPVLITGATGYVGSWVTAAFLAAGAEVHAPVRRPTDEASVAHLRTIDDLTPGRLHLSYGDLLQPGSYDEAMAGCGTVVHTASPFIRHVQDAQRDLIAPAVQGTRNVCESVRRCPSVQRVVVTSSIAAMMTHNDEFRSSPSGMIDAGCWNSSASASYEPYFYSKTQAERVLWAEAESSPWTAATIHPSLVIGPSLAGRTSSDSFATIRMLTGGLLRWGAPQMSLPMVDVRDVALAHVAAATLPGVTGHGPAQAATHRYILSAQNLTLLDAAQCLREQGWDSPALPSRTLPQWLLGLLSPFTGVSRRMLRGNRVEPRLDTQPTRTQLGVTPRPIADGLSEMVAQMEADD